ncbi:UNVERIFIED_CONTAM: hypothetical protein B566_EDAN017949 [Ephemera danica]|nr:hypothetical protein B566_EDAN017949 [Ephemera danica]
MSVHCRLVIKQLCFYSRSINILNSRCMSQIKIKKHADVKDDIESIRNIGILAHIDAGKTTTTERMLFYSGTIQHMGEVHHGNTVTDFMEQERCRGITITSAAVTFWWGKHKFNLIDTPGHIDFTMEVEQTLQVLDGAIVVLDASAGVEAQTCTVWAQADRHKMPRMVYVNKMDRADADLTMCISSLKSRLGASPLLLQMPIKVPGCKGLPGIVDLVTSEHLQWEKTSANKNMHRLVLTKDNPLAEKAAEERGKLVEQLADLDDALAEIVINRESSRDVTPLEVQAAVRRVTLKQLAVPVFCGSSYHNAGIQPLMDAVGLYLPSPLDHKPSQLVQSFHDSLCARVFKVRHDEHLGAVTFLRIYSGSMKKGQKLYNMRLQASEQSAKLMIPYAEDYEDALEINKGNICAVSGLKMTNSGDLMTSGISVAQAAKKSLMKSAKLTEQEADSRLGVGGTIPEPVFFCSIEPPSQREDPSLRVTNDPDTGQTVLAGMGELHLEVIKERIVSEYKIKVELGPMQIAYRETLANPIKDSHSVSQKIDLHYRSF